MKPLSVFKSILAWFYQPEDPFVEIIDAWGCVYLVPREDLHAGRRYLRVFHPANQTPVYSNGEPMLIHRANIKSVLSGENLIKSPS